MSASYRLEIRNEVTDRLIASATVVKRGRGSGRWRIESYPPDGRRGDRYYVDTLDEAVHELFNCARDQREFDARP